MVVPTLLDPKAQPFLDDHRIDGTPVLPGVMGIEAFVEAAQLLALGWKVNGSRGRPVPRPVQVVRDEPRRVEVQRERPPCPRRPLVATCRLDGRRTLPGQPEQLTTHFTGRVVLGPQAPELGTMAPPRQMSGTKATPEAIYQVYFHGPAFQVLGVGAWRDRQNRPSVSGPATCRRTTLRVVGRWSPHRAWSSLCFQTAGLAELATVGSLGLPRQVRRLQIAPGIAEAAARWAVVTTGEAGVDAVVLDGEGHVLVRLSGYETIALPGAVGTDGTDIVGPIEAALR